MAKKQPTKKAAQPAKKKPRVRIRMYRQGLGDCFLLTFDGKTNVLIDCGVIVGTSDPSTIMTTVAEDIQSTTKGKLDVVVATHEHWDHISGFTQAKDVFDKIKFQRVWMAWTEDKTNALAKELRDERETKLRAAKAAAARLKAAPSEALKSLGTGIQRVLGFHGLAADSGDSGGDTGGAMKYVRERGEKDSSDFRTLHPEDAPFTLPGAPNVRVYVLGPPQDKKKIKRSDPSEAHPEVYLSHSRAFAAASSANTSDADEAERAHPFARSYRIPAPTARLHPSASPDLRRVLQTYHAEPYRQIEHDWLASAGALALKLDSDTNNTSLVLAFEFIDTGDVLLFPGDAQVGNWLSWHDHEWKVKDSDGTKRTVTAADLLQRTIFYKVGHHGSHNATMKEAGLERMTSKDLVAMVPVNQAMAKKKRWKMPWPTLRSRLEERCSSLILQDEGTPATKPRRGKVAVTDLFIDYTL